MASKPAPRKKKAASAKPAQAKKATPAPKAKPPPAPKAAVPARAASAQTRPAVPPPPAPKAAAPQDLLPAPRPAMGDIPWAYGDTRVTAMARDPHWIFAYWEIPDEGIAEARRRIGDDQAWCSLRVYDTTHKLFDGLNANQHWDIGVDRAATHHYIHVGRPGAVFHIDVGVRRHDGSFAPIARSGAVEMPRDSVSPATPSDWSTVLRSGPGYAYRHRYVPRPGGPAPRGEALEPGPAGELDRVFESLGGEGWTRTEWIETLMDSRVVRWVRWTGPFLPDRLPFAPAGTWKQVEVLLQGERRVERFAGGERFVYGPWRVTLETVGPSGERRKIEQWMVRHRWITEEGRERVETPAILQRILGGRRAALVQGGSEERMEQELWGSELVQLGASEWRWLGSSETLLAGASETLGAGASETLFLGATEVSAAGASELRWLGASEVSFLGDSGSVRTFGSSEERP